MVSDLKRDGFLILRNYVSDSKIDELQIQFASNISKKENISELSQDTEIAGSYNAQKIILKDSTGVYIEAKKIALSEGILKVVCSYFSALPLFSISVYRNLYERERLGSRNFHRDDEGMLSCFIYLTDVSTQEGGHLIVVMKSNKFRYKSFSPIDNLSKGEISNNLDYSDEEIEKYYPRNLWKSLYINEGDLLIVDVSAFHKGLPGVLRH